MYRFKYFNELMTAQIFCYFLYLRPVWLKPLHLHISIFWKVKKRRIVSLSIIISTTPERVITTKEIRPPFNNIEFLRKMKRPLWKMWAGRISRPGFPRLISNIRISKTYFTVWRSNILRLTYIIAYVAFDLYHR